jgi:hypothetical protein
MLDELLDREIFYTVREARHLVEMWRKEYNQIRPHNALGYKPPTPSDWIAITEPLEQVSLTLKFDQKVGLVRRTEPNSKTQ